MEHTLWCGLERAEKVSYGCTKYELRGVSLLDTRVLLVNRSITGSSACRSFACVHVRLAVHRGAVVLQSCPVVPVPLLWMAAVPHLAAVHAVLTDFCLQGPLSPKFSAPAAGTGRGRWRSKTRVKCWSVRASVRSGDPPRRWPAWPLPHCGSVCVCVRLATRTAVRMPTNRT